MKTFFLTFLVCLLSLSASHAQKMRIDKDKDIINTRDEIIPGYFIVDVGLSMLSSAPDPMELSLLNSQAFYLSYMGNVDLSSQFKMLVGLSLGVDNYRFREDVSLRRGDNVLGEEKIIFYELPQSDIKKSKFSVTYIDLPLEFHFIPKPTKKGFRIGIGGKIGLPVSAATKIKYEQNDDNFKEKVKNNFFLSPVRYGLQTRIGYGSFYIFGYYGLNTLFQEDKLDCNCGGGNPITVGITLFAF